ncbi:hypothetical protein [Microbispora sp. NPDC046933]|uniref:hypothetical protein n=1 Tax=Microbispora sp. NPDC046933 TaxID=3155618 RepID=UPI0034007844
MAGTLLYHLHVAHIYQRRFDSASLAEALKASHWYLITRRPAVKLIPRSFRYADQIITASFATRDSVTGMAHVHNLGADVRGLGEISDFQDYADGSYFSFRAGGELVHGDSWTLASLMAEARGDLSKHEVIYAGQAFGGNASTNSYERTLAHKKLQRIYEDHVDSDYEIFVVPLVWDRISMINDDHIDDAENGPDLYGYYENFVTLDGRLLQASVDLIEHSLISYFTPHYNEKLLEWRTTRPTDAMRKMRSARFRLLHVHLSGWHGLARLCSPSVSTTAKSHLISQDLPSAEASAPHVLRGISAKEISDWRYGAFLLREGREIVANLTENSGAAMRIFGDAAPAIRKPPGIKLYRPEVVPDASDDVSDHNDLRNGILQAREFARRAEEPPRHPDLPTYDVATGTIQYGEYQDGTPARLQLNDPKTGGVNSLLIIGDSGMGKSSALLTLMAEAYGSAVFDVVLADPTNRNDLVTIGSIISKGLPVATSVEAATHVLEATLNVISERKKDGGYGTPTPKKPGLLIAIDDADDVLMTAQGSKAVREILSSGAFVGVGLLLVIQDISNITSDQALMGALMKYPGHLAFMPEGYYVIADLKAQFGPRRASTWNGDSMSLVLRRGASYATVALIIARFDPALSPLKVQSMVMSQLDHVNRPITPWEEVENADHWHALDMNMQEWALARHADAWVLTASLSTISGTALDSGADAIKWANGVFGHRFEADLTPWQSGPTVGGVATLYADVKGSISRRENSLESMFRLFAERVEFRPEG